MNAQVFSHGRFYALLGNLMLALHTVHAGWRRRVHFCSAKQDFDDEVDARNHLLSSNASKRQIECTMAVPQ